MRLPQAKERETYTPVPAVPERVHANVEADAETKRSGEDGCDVYTYEDGLVWLDMGWEMQ